jgi:hypothetical protein
MVNFISSHRVRFLRNVPLFWICTPNSRCGQPCSHLAQGLYWCTHRLGETSWAPECCHLDNMLSLITCHWFQLREFGSN